MRSKSVFDYIHADARPLIQAKGYSLYSSPERNGHIALAGFLGKSVKPVFHVAVPKAKAEDFAARKALELASRVEAAAEWKEKRKNERNEHRDAFLASLKPGVILVRSWGYDQTNVNFYQVQSVSGSKVTFQEIAQKEEYTGYGYGTTVALPDEFIKEPITTVVRSAGLKVNDWDSVSKVWDGRPCHFSDNR